MMFVILSIFVAGFVVYETAQKRARLSLVVLSLGNVVLAVVNMVVS